ncbi:hypothetical protein GCM10010528_15520 [Gordonia defluvii]|jgi:hypothetical protein|uniref:Uncharacterized protein n=1 Tax=Gordonia defluvii TaxID=283718 RepID=A0ABP6LCJ3_9ACTN|nr:hypothetical protein [Gordonia sp. UBA5067]
MPLLRFGCAAALTLALTGPASTVPFAAAAPRVDYTLRVCASDTTPTNATITYGVGVGESVAEQGRTSRWLGAGCWERTVAAYTYDGAAVAATATNPQAYIGCAVWANGRRIAKHYAYGRCSTSARAG